MTRGWTRGAAAIAVVVATAAWTGSARAAGPSTARAARGPTVAALQLSAERTRPHAPVIADTRHTRMAPGRRLAVAVLRFGDNTRAVRMRRFRAVRHRYAHRGRFRVTLAVRDRLGRVSRAHRVVVVGRSLAVAAPRSRTLVADPADVRQVRGSAAGTQVVVFAANSATPQVGQVLVVPVSGADPDGVLGVVVHRTRLSHGRISVTSRPAALGQAYRSLRAEGTLGEARVATAPGARFHLGGTGIRCSGPEASPAISADIDLSQLHYSLDFQPLSPSLQMSIIGQPQIELGVGVGAQASCHWTLPVHVTVPIAGTPVLLRLSPVLELGAEGTLRMTLTWTPHIAFGFERGSVNSDTRVFNPGKVTPDVTADAGASLFFGARADLSLGGRVGVGADFGPEFDFKLHETHTQACLESEVGLKLAVTADADAFVRNWSFAIASGTFAKRQLLAPRCNAAAPGSTTPTPTPAGATITPGQGIAGVSLGDAPATVRARWGAPTSTGTTPDGAPVWYYGGGGPGTLRGVTFRNGVVQHVYTTRSGDRTSAGVGPGTTLAAVRQAYPQAACGYQAPGSAYICRLSSTFNGRPSSTFFIFQSSSSSGVAQEVAVFD